MNTTTNVIIETTKTSDTYILDLLIDTDKEDETQGYSERWIFDTETEQLEQKAKLENEYGIKQGEVRYDVTVNVKELNYSKVFTVEAERVGQAQTRAMMKAFDDGLRTRGEFVEYEVTLVK